MKAQEAWKPTKFVFDKSGRLRASRDRAEVYTGSRISADLNAAALYSALQAHAQGVLIDLGCGKVPLYHTYRDLVDETVCVDWPGSQHGVTHIDVFQDLNNPLELESSSADTVLMTSVLEHIYKPEALLSEIFRVLRPGGKLIMNTPFFYWTHEIPHDYFRYTKFFYHKYAEEEGVKLLSLEEIGGFPHVVFDLLGRAAGQVPLIGGGIVGLLMLLSKVPPMRKVADKTKERVTLGHLVVLEKPVG